MAGTIDRFAVNPAEHEQKAQKLTFDDIRRDAQKQMPHVSPSIPLGTEQHALKHANFIGRCPRRIIVRAVGLCPGGIE